MWKIIPVANLCPYWPRDVNEVMKNRFSEPYPARATVEVSALPLGVDIEMDAIVSLNE